MSVRAAGQRSQSDSKRRVSVCRLRCRCVCNFTTHRDVNPTVNFILRTLAIGAEVAAGFLGVSVEEIFFDESQL